MGTETPGIAWRRNLYSLLKCESQHPRKQHSANSLFDNIAVHECPRVYRVDRGHIVQPLSVRVTEIMPRKRPNATAEPSSRPPPDQPSPLSSVESGEITILGSRGQLLATSAKKKKNKNLNRRRRQKARLQRQELAPLTQNSSMPHVSNNNHTTPRHNNAATTEEAIMSPISPAEHNSTAPSSRSLPPPYTIQVAKPYIFQQTIDQCLRDLGVSQTREDNIRLAGVQWIDSVRKALRL